MTPRTLAVLFSFTVLGGSTAAQAQAIRAVRVEYTLEPGAPRCPTDQVFRDTVTGRTRFDPFVKDAPVRLIVTVSYRAGHYYGRAELQGASEPWSQDVSPPPRDCRTLIHALGAYVANKLDPPGPLSASPDAKPPSAELPAKLPPAGPPPAEPPSEPRPAPVQAVPEARPARSFELRGGVNANLALWIAPSDLAFEGAGDFGFAWSVFALSAELRFAPPATRDFRFSPPTGTGQSTPSADDGVELSTYRVAGALVPCLRWPLSKSRLKPTPFACGVIQSGGVFVSGSGLDGDRTLPYLAAGGRLAFELNLFKWLTGRLGTDFLAVASRPLIFVMGQPLWQAPAFSMAVGGGLVASFFP